MIVIPDLWLPLFGCILNHHEMQGRQFRLLNGSTAQEHTDRGFEFTRSFSVKPISGTGNHGKARNRKEQPCSGATFVADIITASTRKKQCGVISFPAEFRPSRDSGHLGFQNVEVEPPALLIQVKRLQQKRTNDRILNRPAQRRIGIGPPPVSCHPCFFLLYPSLLQNSPIRRFF